jgi:pimeloyl-ACP methyl ester carboxylesterase
MARDRGSWLAAAIVATLAAAAGFAAVRLMRPLRPAELRPDRPRTADHDDALARFAAIELAEDALPLVDEGRSILLDHGEPTGRVAVLFHGYTDQPAQFRLMAAGLFASGMNVYVPRMPFHGYADRMTSAPSLLSPELLVDYVDEVVDLAVGLGDKVEVVGLSGGGALAAWALTQRPEVDRGVIISPLMLPRGYPAWAMRPMARAVLALPDFYTWWGPLREAATTPAYPRYSMHGIASFLMLVERIKADAGTVAGKRAVVVSNAGDERLDTRYPVTLMKTVLGPEAVTEVAIPAEDRLGHDLVGPEGQNAARIDVAYSHLSRALGVSIPLPDRA